MLPLPTLTLSRLRPALARAHPAAPGPACCCSRRCSSPSTSRAYQAPLARGHHGARGRGGGWRPASPHRARCSGASRCWTRSRASSRWWSASGWPGGAARPGVPPRRATPSAASSTRCCSSSAPGMSLLALSAELITLFINLEILSVATYALAAYLRRGPRPAEAGFKYFILGRVLLGGAALRRRRCSTAPPGAPAPADGGRAGAHLRRADARRPAPARVLRPGAGGRRLRRSRSPRCRSTCGRPDVYEGAPTPVTALMSAAVKAAAFAAMVRVFLVLGNGDPGRRAAHRLLRCWRCLTMVGGNLLALPQRNVKRMLAYSSIAHAGYLLLGVAALFVPERRARGPGRAGRVPLLACGTAPDAPGGAARASSSTCWPTPSPRWAPSACSAALERRRTRTRGIAWDLDRLRRAGAAQAGLGAGDGGLHALARRHPADGRASWGSCSSSAPRWTPAWSGLVIVGVLTSAVGRLLLPAGGRLHVHAPGARGGRAARAQLRPPSWRWC